MELSFRYRIYPTRDQEVLINKTFGCTRFVYNYYLQDHRRSYELTGTSKNYYEQSKDLTNLKTQLVWLKEVDKWSLCNALRDLDRNYKAFYKGSKPYPSLRKKSNYRQTYRTTYTNNNIRAGRGFIVLPKLGKIKARGGRLPQGRILNATIIRRPSGYYYVEICCTDIPEKQKTNATVAIGLDFGLKAFITTSNNTIIYNPFFYKKSMRKLAKLKRNLDRKTIRGKNWDKARRRLAKLHEKIVNQRRDFLHKLSTRIIQANDIICIEDLQIAELIRNALNSDIARSYSDVCWYKFTEQLTYKCKKYGKYLIKVPRYFPSSQICHNCGTRHSLTKDLSIRLWECPTCGSILDRDVNAAINIRDKGLILLK